MKIITCFKGKGRNMMVTGEQTCFKNRAYAGGQLTDKLWAYRGNCVVLAVPNGGIPVAVEVAGRLGADVDVVLVHKLRVPFDFESGYGAIAGDGSAVYSRAVAKKLGISDRDIQRQAALDKNEIAKRSLALRGNQPFPSLVGKVAILVDDGMASGYTMAAAVKTVRCLRAGKIVVATPVATEPAYQIVKSLSDEVVCPIVSRSSWFTVAGFYRDWEKISDSGALSCMNRFREERAKVLGGASR